MTSSRRLHDDDGLTLIEAVIAMLILSIAVITLVGALAVMVEGTRKHRGQAVTETASRSFAQAVQALAQSSTSLSSAVSASATSFTLSDDSTLPPASSSTYLLVDREIVRLDSYALSGGKRTGTIAVIRAQGGTTAAAHTAGTSVVPLLRCPTTALLTPDPGAYNLPPGAAATVTKVEYYDPADQSFSDPSTPDTSPPSPTSRCEQNYAVRCPGTTLSPECSTAVFRVSIEITTPGDSRLENVTTTTQVWVRSGSV